MEYLKITTMIKMDTRAGQRFDDAAITAQAWAHKGGDVCSFRFNDILCLVSADTDLEKLKRDYDNAHLMRWETIGPTCEDYSDELTAAINQRRKEAGLKRQQQREECRMEEDVRRKAFEQKTAGVVPLWKDDATYESWKAKNTDAYGSAIFEYAECVAKLMQVGVAQKDAEKQANFLGMSGFQHGAALQVLKGCWAGGEVQERA